MILTWSLIWVLFGHPDTTGNAAIDKPKTCEQWCDVEQCRCFDKCGFTYLNPKPICTGNCNKQKDACKRNCAIEKPALRSQ